MDSVAFNPADYVDTYTVYSKSPNPTVTTVNDKTGESKTETGETTMVHHIADVHAEFTPETIMKLTGATTFEPTQVKIVFTENGDINFKYIVVHPAPEKPAATASAEEVKAWERQMETWRSELTLTK